MKVNSLIYYLIVGESKCRLFKSTQSDSYNLTQALPVKTGRPRRLPLSCNTSQIGLAVLMVGISDLITQGFLVGKLKNILDERNLSMIGLGIASVAYELATFDWREKDRQI